MNFTTFLLNSFISSLLLGFVLSSHDSTTVTAENDTHVTEGVQQSSFDDSKTAAQSYRRAQVRLRKHLRHLDIATEKVGPLLWTPENGLTKLTLNVTVMAVNDVSDSEQTMSTFLLCGIEWQDDMLAWNTSQYGGVTNMYLPVDSIWTPYIYVMSSPDLGSVIPGQAPSVNVESSGRVRADFNYKTTTVCPMDLARFPFDQQACSIMFFAADFDLQLNLHQETAANKVIDYITRISDWDIIDVVAELSSLFSSGENPFPQVTVTLRRRTTFYTVCLVLPMVLCSYMNTLVFLLPLESGEKVSYLVTLSVSTSVFTSFFIDMMPRGLASVPDIMKLLIGVIVQSVLTLVATILVLRRHQQEQGVRAPQASDDDNTATEGQSDHIATSSTGPDTDRQTACGARCSRAQHGRRVTKSPHAHDTQGRETAQQGCRRCGFGWMTAKMLDHSFFALAFVVNTIFLSVLYASAWSE